MRYKNERQQQKSLPLIFVRIVLSTLCLRLGAVLDCNKDFK